MKRLLAGLLLLVSASSLFAQATSVWVPWSTGWVRWDGGPTAGTNTGVTSCDASTISSLLACSVALPGLTITAPTMAAKTFWAGPTSGAAALPTARGLAVGDIFGIAGTTQSTSTSGTTITNTAAETSIVTITIPAATNTTTTRYVLEIWGTWHEATTTASMVFKLYYGASPVITTTAFTPGTAATDGPYYIRSDLVFLGSTSSQLNVLNLVLGNRTASTLGIGDISTGWSFNGTTQNTSSVDSTVDQTYKLTITFGTAQPTVNIVKVYARMTRYPD